MEKHYLRPKGKGIRLHLGCGDWWFEGFLNIDAGVFGATDMICDISQPLPFQPETVEEIQAHDVVEHFSKDDIDKMLDDWKKVLIDGGRICVTLPEIDELTKQYTEAEGENKRLSLQAIYGILNDHKWGYNLETGRELFESHGFKNVEVKPIDTGKDNCPRMEITCNK